MLHTKFLAATAATALILSTAGFAVAQQSMPPASTPAPMGAQTQGMPAAGGAMSDKLDLTTLVEVKDKNAMAPGLNVSANDLKAFDVYGTDGKKIGNVDRVLGDRTDAVKAVTVEVGGFLGMGSRQVVIPLDRLQKGTEAKQLRTAMTKDEIQKLDAWSGHSDTTTRP